MCALILLNGCDALNDGDNSVNNPFDDIFTYTNNGNAPNYSYTITYHMI